MCNGMGIVVDRYQQWLSNVYVLTISIHSYLSRVSDMGFLVLFYCAGLGYIALWWLVRSSIQWTSG